MNDEGVGARNVEPGFDDGGGQQHIRPSFIESLHAVFELACAHSAVGDDEAHLRHLLPQEALELGQVLDARHDDEGLSAAIVFAQQRLTQDQRIELQHEGPHGQTIDGRRRDKRKIPDARERQL